MTSEASSKTMSRQERRRKERLYEKANKTQEKDDWIEDLRGHILNEVKGHGELGFWGVILKQGGRMESLMAGHPQVEVQHFFDHVLQALNEDIAYEEMK